MVGFICFIVGFFTGGTIGVICMAVVSAVHNAHDYEEALDKEGGS